MSITKNQIISGLPGGLSHLEYRLINSIGISLTDWILTDCVLRNTPSGVQAEYLAELVQPSGVVSSYFRARAPGDPTTETLSQPISFVYSSSTAVVNTSGDGVVRPSGTYSPDGLAPGLYCDILDVYEHGLAMPWEILNREFNKIKTLLASKASDLPTLISETLIPKAEARADAICRQTYKPTVMTRYFDGDGGKNLFLPSAPVLELIKCAIFVIPGVPFYEFTRPRFTQSLGEVDPRETYQDADLLVDPETGEIEIPARVLYNESFFTPLWNYVFIEGQKNIMVTWKYGFLNKDVVPENFRSAVSKLVCIRLLECLGIPVGGGLASFRSGDTASVVGREKNMPYSDLITRFDGEVKSLLHPYTNFTV